MALEFMDAGFAYPLPSGAVDDGGAGAFGPAVVGGLSLTVRPGEVTLLCGESGCGKSTALKMANGLIPHYVRGCLYGDVLLDGASVGELPLWEVARRVGSVFQNPRTQMFNAEVRSELAFACENAGMDPREIRERIARVAEAMRCGALLDRTVFRLSGGERQKVACLAVSVPDPEVVVLDEPSSNLDTRAIDDLRSFIAAWKDAGKAVLVAEHRVYYLRDLVDEAIYLRCGRVERRWDGEGFRALGAAETSGLGLRRVWPEACAPRDASRADGDCGRAGGGEPGRAGADDPCTRDGVAARQPPAASPAPAASARVEGLACTYGRRSAARRVLDVGELELPVGVPVALVGPNGAGKSTFLRTLCGLSRRSEGTCSLPGGPALDAAARLRDGYLVMQDVTSQLFCSSVLEEVTLGAGGGAVRAEGRARAVLGELDLAELADAHPLALSGGQQQRVSVAAAVASGRRIVLFDEPTSGLDLRHMRAVAELVTRVAVGEAGEGGSLREAGVPRLVMVISHDYEFVCACC